MDKCLVTKIERSEFHFMILYKICTVKRYGRTTRLPVAHLLSGTRTSPHTKEGDYRKQTNRLRSRPLRDGGTCRVYQHPFTDSRDQRSASDVDAFPIPRTSNAPVSRYFLGEFFRLPTNPIFGPRFPGCATGSVGSSDRRCFRTSSRFEAKK